MPKMSMNGLPALAPLSHSSLGARRLSNLDIPRCRGNARSVDIDLERLSRDPCRRVHEDVDRFRFLFLQSSPHAMGRNRQLAVVCPVSVVRLQLHCCACTGMMTMRDESRGLHWSVSSIGYVRFRASGSCRRCASRKVDCRRGGSFVFFGLLLREIRRSSAFRDPRTRANFGAISSCVGWRHEEGTPVRTWRPDDLH